MAPTEGRVASGGAAAAVPPGIFDIFAVAIIDQISLK